MTAFIVSGKLGSLTCAHRSWQLPRKYESHSPCRLAEAHLRRMQGKQDHIPCRQQHAAAGPFQIFLKRSRNRRSVAPLLMLFQRFPSVDTLLCFLLHVGSLICLHGAIQGMWNTQRIEYFWENNHAGPALNAAVTSWPHRHELEKMSRGKHAAGLMHRITTMRLSAKNAILMMAVIMAANFE
jgi:hypothetical protein